jgi:urocanate hydratase
MRHGVLLQYSAHHNLVESNTVVRTTYDAFDLHGEDEYGNELRSKVAENCGEGGFGSATRLQPRERRTGHLGPPQPG